MTSEPSAPSLETLHPATGHPEHRHSAERGWWIHLAVFLVVNTGLMAAAAAGPLAHNGHGPTAGWALGLAVHGLSAFVLSPGSRVRRALKIGGRP